MKHINRSTVRNLAVPSVVGTSNEDPIMAGNEMKEVARSAASSIDVVNGYEAASKLTEQEEGTAHV